MLRWRDSRRVCGQRRVLLFAVLTALVAILAGCEVIFTPPDRSETTPHVSVPQADARDMGCSCATSADRTA